MRRLSAKRFFQAGKKAGFSKTELDQTMIYGKPMVHAEAGEGKKRTAAKTRKLKQLYAKHFAGQKKYELQDFCVLPVRSKTRKAPSYCMPAAL